MERTCTISGERFVITEFEAEFCAKHELPLPIISPHERLRRMLIFRNRLYLHHGHCSYSGKPFLTAIPPGSGLTVYDVDVWESDAWDGREYGRPYDFSRPFFEQFAELLQAAPLPNLSVVRSSLENTDYGNGVADAKNCYLIFGSIGNEDCMFSKCLFNTRDIVDSVFVFDSELCYSCRDLQNCYDLKYSSHCQGCSNSTFLFGCTGCTNCYGCVNLRQKEYHFFNEKLAKKEYEARLADIDLGSYEVCEREQERFAEFAGRFPRRAFFGTGNEGCSGNFLNNSKNCTDVRFATGCEDVAHGIYLTGAKSAVCQAHAGNGAELLYNCTSNAKGAYNIKFSNECWQNVSDLEYCFFCCHGTSKSFGCAGLKKASYCILNKQYSKDEYENLLPRIKEHMRAIGEYGLFFPKEMSPHCYNESEVFDHFPLEQVRAESAGFRWKKEEPPAERAFTPFPDHISDVRDEVVSQEFRCEKTGKAFRLVKPELAYYRRQCIPLPRIAPLERLKERVRLFNIQPLRTAPCAKCSKSMETVYSDCGQEVYCESCYGDELT